MHLDSAHPKLGTLPRQRTGLWRRAALGALAALALSTPLASAQPLVDPSFEFNPLESHYDVLDFFATYQGRWGVETASITGAVGAITPPHGSNMLAMVDNAGFATQAWQVTDVSANPLIPSGSATFALDALFNIEGVAAAQAIVTMQFFSGPGLAFEIPGSQLSTSLILDNNTASWEKVALSGSIPASTTWMASQVAYWNSTMEGQPGYVDVANFSITPAPGSLCLLTLGGLLASRRRRSA